MSPSSLGHILYVCVSHYVCYILSITIVHNYVKGPRVRLVKCDKYCKAHGCATRKNK